MTATVSIILPTYNRARFLPQAIQSIHDQQFADWELIVVDDGSTDETPELIKELTAQIVQPVQYIRQPNQGAYGARNTGLDCAGGKYVAFFDSDDLWLPHHLKDCVEALETNPDVDWVYGACQVVDYAAGNTISQSTFYVDGSPRAFMKLCARAVGQLRIIDDPGILQCMILDGLWCGLQNSVIRSKVFAAQRFEFGSRNEAEDQLFVIRCLVEGRTIAYLDNLHVVYRVHNENSSAAGGGCDVDRQMRVLRLTAEGYEQILSDYNWQPRERRALRQRIQQDYFWRLGYSTLWSTGKRAEAIQMFRCGLRHWPWDWRCWKTFALATARQLASSKLF